MWRYNKMHSSFSRNLAVNFWNHINLTVVLFYSFPSFIFISLLRIERRKNISFHWYKKTFALCINVHMYTQAQIPLLFKFSSYPSYDWNFIKYENPGADGMAQQIKVITAKPDDLSSSPARPHIMGRGENCLLLWLPTQMHPHIHTVSKCKYDKLGLYSVIKHKRVSLCSVELQRALMS